MKKLIAILSLVVLSGCATIQDQNLSAKLAVQYTTLKVVEEDKLSKQGIQDTVTFTRRLIETDGRVDLTQLKSSVLGYIDVTSLEPSNQLLVLTLLDEIEQQLEERTVEGDYVESVSVLLDWVEQSLMLIPSES